MTRVFVIILLLKAIYFVLILASLLLFPDFDLEKFKAVHIKWPRQANPVFLSHFATWDAAHYIYLSEKGYSNDIPSNAFYPLWPILVRYFSYITGGNHVIAGLILSNLFSAYGFSIFFLLVKQKLGHAAAWWSLVSLLAFPGTVFFQFAYSESLFFLLSMVFVMGLEKRSYLVVSIAGFLLPLTRPVGILCIVPLLWKSLVAWYLNSTPSRLLESNRLEARGQTTMQENDQLKFVSRLSTLPNFSENDARQESFIDSLFRSGAAVALVPILGYVLYFVLMQHWTGSPWEGFEAQKFWRHTHSINNLFDPLKFFVGLFTPTSFHAFKGSLLDRLAFLLFIICLPGIWKLEKTWFVWAITLGLIPAMSGTFTSFIRFAALVFPLFVALGAKFSRHSETSRLRNFVVACFLICHAILVWRIVNFRWAG